MSTEARRNTIALLVVAVILAVFAAFSFRPAVILPVTDHAVADSLDLFGHPYNVHCRHTPAGFRCVAKTGSYVDVKTERLLVHVGWDGCWRSVQQTNGQHADRASGCVHLWNYVG